MAKKPTKKAYHPGGNVPPRRPQVRPPVGTPKRRPPKRPPISGVKFIPKLPNSDLPGPKYQKPITVKGPPVRGTPTPKRPPKQGGRTGPLTPNQKRLRRLNNKANRVDGRIARLSERMKNDAKPKKTIGVLPGGPGIIGSGPNTQKRLTPKALQAKRMQEQVLMREQMLRANKAKQAQARRNNAKTLRTVSPKKPDEILKNTVRKAIGLPRKKTKNT